MVSPRDCERKLSQASFVAPANISLRHIMSAECYSICDSGDVDVGVLCANINKEDLKATLARLCHHLQVVVTGERGLDCEAAAGLQE